MVKMLSKQAYMGFWGHTWIRFINLGIVDK